MRVSGFSIQHSALSSPSRVRFDDDSGAGAEGFCGAGRFGADFGGVVVESDGGVSGDGAGVVDEELVSLPAGLLAHCGVGANVSADDGFESAEDALGDGGGG